MQAFFAGTGSRYGVVNALEARGQDLSDLNVEFQFAGEYEYMKTLWGLNEVMIATLKVFERTRAEWVARYFGMAYRVMKEKFSQKPRGYPAGYVLFAHRRMTPQPHVARQDDYHPIRQLMVNLLTINAMLGAPTPQ